MSHVPPNPEGLRLVDTHAHVTAARFDEDRGEMLGRARQAGVAAIVAIGAGYGWDHNERVLELSAAEPWIRAAVGLHPQDAPQWGADGYERVANWLRRPEAVAVGETGLDYARDYAEHRAAQLAAFAAHCALAVEHRKPLVVHTRDAFDDTVAVLREHGIGRDVPGIIHFFTGDRATAEAYLDMGLWLSVPGVVTLPNAPDLVAAVPQLPLDRLLIETDSPYAAPVPRRGRRNEPANVAYVAAKVAELQGRPTAEVAAQTTANAVALFGLSLATDGAP